MTKVNISIALLALFSITAFAAQDCSNPMLTTFTSIVGTAEATPATVTSSYCKNIASGASCCAATGLDGLQTAADDLVSTLQGFAETRDTMIVDARDTVVPGLASNIEELTTQIAAVQALITAAGSTAFDEDSTNNWSNDGATAVLTALTSVITYSTGSTITADLTTYQATRATCLTALIKLQASAWCLACDADYADSKGVVVASSAVTDITLSTDLQARLQTACYDYIAAAETISSLILASTWTGTLVDGVATALKGIADDQTAGDTISFADFTTALTALVGAQSSTAALAAVEIPSSCTSTTCTWIYDTLFNLGELDNDLATQGGAASAAIDDTPARRLLEESRRLQTNEWSPDADDSGVSVSFPTDPAGVNPSGAMKLMSGLICLGAMFAALVL